MKKLKVILLTLFICFISFINAQENEHIEIPLLGRINYDSLRNVELNDVWGYVDQEGNEYAIVGTTEGVSIVSLADPSNPEEIFWLAGMETTWRDIKVYNNHAYVTAEVGEGLRIIDLNPLPHDPITSVTNFFPPIESFWNTAHNLWIDEEKGYCFIFGANRGNGGVIILDLNEDPKNPVEIGVFDEWYVHDGYVKDDRMYLAHIFEGFFSIIDVSDIENPVILATQETPLAFTHNIWPTDDGKYVFTTDEKAGGHVTCYDITNLSQIQEIDRIQSTPNSEVIPHNVHVMHNYIITSFYTDGVTIHEISDPTNIVETGRHLTYKGSLQTGYNGCWGAYPFLPSKLLLASDMQYGLYVLKPEYDIKEPDLSTEINDLYASIKIYPNPSQHIITVEGMFEPSELNLIDQLGKVVYNNYSNKESTHISIAHLPNGVYTLFINKHPYKIIKH